MSEAVVLRRIFPRKSTCPNCGSTALAGRPAVSRGGEIQYRTCRCCRQTYPVAAIAVEVDTGGRTSQIREP